MAPSSKTSKDSPPKRSARLAAIAKAIARPSTRKPAPSAGTSAKKDGPKESKDSKKVANTESGKPSSKKKPAAKPTAVKPTAPTPKTASKSRKPKEIKDSEDEGGSEHEAPSSKKKKKPATKAPTPKTTSKARKRKVIKDSEDEDEEDSGDEEPSSKKRKATKTKVSKATTSAKRVRFEEVKDSQEDEDSESEAPPPKRPRTTRTAAPSKTESKTKKPKEPEKREAATTKKAVPAPGPAKPARFVSVVVPSRSTASAPGRAHKTEKSDVLDDKEIPETTVSIKLRVAAELADEVEEFLKQKYFESPLAAKSRAFLEKKKAAAASHSPLIGARREEKEGASGKGADLAVAAKPRKRAGLADEKKGRKPFPTAPLPDKSREAEVEKRPHPTPSASLSGSRDAVVRPELLGRVTTADLRKMVAGINVERRVRLPKSSLSKEYKPAKTGEMTASTPKAPLIEKEKGEAATGELEIPETPMTTKVTTPSTATGSFTMPRWFKKSVSSLKKGIETEEETGSKKSAKRKFGADDAPRDSPVPKKVSKKEDTTGGTARAGEIPETVKPTIEYGTPVPPMTAPGSRPRFSFEGSRASFDKILSPRGPFSAPSALGTAPVSQTAPPSAATLGAFTAPSTWGTAPAAWPSAAALGAFTAPSAWGTVPTAPPSAALLGALGAAPVGLGAGPGKDPCQLHISEEIGDLFEGLDDAVLIHACNCYGSWGGGIAATFKKRYPKAYQYYKDFCHARKAKPGEALLIPPLDEGKKHWIGCVFTSKNTGKYLDPPDTILASTALSVQDLMEKVNSEVRKGNHISELRMCKINSGLFKVPWDDTLDALKLVTLTAGAPNKITVYVFGE